MRRDTDETEGWEAGKKKTCEKVKGEDRVSEGRNEEERGKGDEKKDKRRLAL